MLPKVAFDKDKAPRLENFDAIEDLLMLSVLSVRNLNPPVDFISSYIPEDVLATIFGTFPVGCLDSFWFAGLFRPDLD